ncbi:DUF6457 domain-containing protein [Micromonospora sp. NPDC047548]|uniref:DUF6457 domain-containing protein n=1 Tax=Micromonospora sp. NPDC047548 TaxID=3155624 RepID=UPI0033CC0DC0
MIPGPQLDEWLARAAAALDLDTLSAEDTRAVLNVVREVAHGVQRPAAPLAAYLIGVAVGRGADPTAARVAVAALVPQDAQAREAP